MATLFELCDNGVLIRLDAGLGDGEFDERRIYLIPKVRDWIERDLPTLQSTYQLELTPAEQLYALFYQFCVGKPLAGGGRYKKLNPRDRHVWELKTGDLRIFGWFPQMDVFIVCAIHDATRVKEIQLYAGFREEVVRVRNTMPLDEPKCIEGDEYDDVLSNCS
jgi:hypothetical protein